MVRPIQEGHVFKKIMCDRSLTAADLARLRAEKKNKKEKEVKEKKDRESQAGISYSAISQPPLRLLGYFPSCFYEFGICLYSPFSNVNLSYPVPND